jgi:hypothetical protein
MGCLKEWVFPRQSKKFEGMVKVFKCYHKTPCQLLCCFGRCRHLFQYVVFTVLGIGNQAAA